MTEAPSGPTAPIGLRYPGVERRRVGRPRAPEATTAVSIRLPVSEYDRIYRLASAQRTTVNDFLRTVVTQKK